MESIDEDHILNVRYGDLSWEHYPRSEWHGLFVATNSRLDAGVLASPRADARLKVRNQNPVRILCFDGGGSNAMNSRMCTKKIAELVGDDWWQRYDLLCGTSCGAVLATDLVMSSITGDWSRSILVCEGGRD